MKFVYDDGGRKGAGRRGEARDCVCRAIAIATARPYAEVYDALQDRCYGLRFGRDKLAVSVAMGRKFGARDGVPRKAYDPYLRDLGAEWTPTMRIGSGCKVHLRDGELPMGRLIVSVSRHLCAVIDGVIHDTFDPSRGGTRCVYGYWKFGATG